MIERLQQRIAQSERQGGFTLIELLVVIIIIGILLAIAVPSYLRFQDRANDSAAKSNVRSALPSVEAWYSDHGGYADMTAAKLRASYDAGLSNTVTARPSTTFEYCISSTVGGKTWRKAGPTADISSGAAC